MHRERRARSVEEAREIALNSLELFGRDNRDGVSRNQQIELTNSVITSRLTRGGDVDTLIHVVDFGNNQGFVLVGGPIESDPLLAYVESGNFNDEETSEVEGFQFF